MIFAAGGCLNGPERRGKPEGFGRLSYRGAPRTRRRTSQTSEGFAGHYPKKKNSSAPGCVEKTTQPQERTKTGCVSEYLKRRTPGGRGIKWKEKRSRYTKRSSLVFLEGRLRPYETRFGCRKIPKDLTGLQSRRKTLGACRCLLWSGFQD